MQTTSRQITAIYQNVQDVGKNIKASKKRYTWVLDINGKIYNIILDVSMISNKIKLTCNNQLLSTMEDQPIELFQHTFTLNSCQISILSISTGFQLRINNKAFGHLLTQERTNKQFIRSSNACQDFVLDQKLKAQNNNNGLKKTIKLKIGTMKNDKKLTSIKIESDDWNKMMNGEQQNHFPNFFSSQKNKSVSETVDLSNVSMKKKNPVLVQEQPILSFDKFQEQQTQIIEITPEQFSTMQNLFRTQIPVSMNSIQSNSINQSFLPELNLMDFNTMQMMFQTNLGVSFQRDQITKQSSEKETIKQQAPLEFTLNVQDFNTMQMMFNTMNLGSNIKKEQTYDNHSDLLKTITSLQTPVQQEVKYNSLANQSINLNDFNTMQQMFATNKNNPLNFISPITYLNQPSQNENISSNPLDFSTMGNLFKTINYGQISENRSYVEAPLISQNKQNLFAQIEGKQQIQIKENNFSSTLGLSNSSNNVNIQAINMSDFSTMQNLFKTNNFQALNSNLFDLKQNNGI